MSSRGGNMKLRRVVLLLCVLLLATPVMAQKLPRPNILSIAIYELEEEEGIHGWTLLVFWQRVPEAERGASGYEVEDDRYAIRLWQNGNKKKAPKVSHRIFYDQYAPTHSEWVSVGNSNGHGECNDERIRRVCVAIFRGYDENQEVKLRMRAIDENGVYGRMSKVFTVKLPEFGALGNPKREVTKKGTWLTSSEVRLVYGGNYFWWQYE